MAEGTIWLEFKATGPGYLAIGFHYHSSENHYALELFPKKCRLRQAQPLGKYSTILEVADTCGYKENKWHQLVIRRKLGKILVYMSPHDDKESLEMVINNSITWGLSKGVFALMAMNTPVTFTKIRVMTNDDFESTMTLDEGDLSAQKVGAEAMASATA